MDWQVTIEPIKGKTDNPAHDLPEGRTFAIGTQQIVFGRESNCDIVFPPDARMVGARHGRLLRQASGDYVIEAFGNHTLLIDGYPPTQGQAIADTATIRFGNSRGPMIRVRLAREARNDGLKDTIDQEVVVPISKVAARIKIGLAALAAVVVAVIGVQLWMYFDTGARFQRQMDEMRSALSEQARNTLPDTKFLGAAAFAVILEDDDGRARVVGTAWPIDAGMLVTNAHVAVAMDSLKPGERMYVRKPGESRNIPVTGKRIHDGYAAFNEFIDKAIDDSQGFEAATDGAAMPSAYDVAILDVDPAEDLGDHLKVSKDSAALTVGAALAFAGYPIEGTGAQKLAQLSPNPVLQFGRVTALSNYFLFSADKPDALLIENSLPATGGASGSPIVDASGEVVAVLSGGTVDFHDGIRRPSAVMLNYAQRADLIDEVLVPARFNLEAAKATWEKALTLFDRHEETEVAKARAALEQKTGGPVDVAEDPTPSLKTSEAVTVGPTRYREHAVTVAAGRTYTFLAYGDYDGTLNLMLLRQGKGVGAAFGASWFASLTYTAERDETLTLRVLGQTKHQVDYDLITLSAGKTVAAAPSTN